MPTVKYLNHEIRVDPGGSSRGEVAWCVVDGERRCFLGGEEEARRFLRERRMGPRFGPRAATWSVELLDSGSSTHVATEARARETMHYFAGRPVRMSRVELCPVPGCDGHGTVTEKLRSGRYGDRPCPQHAPIVEVVEAEGVPEEGCGFGVDGAPCYACESRERRECGGADTPGA